MVASRPSDAELARIAKVLKIAERRDDYDLPWSFAVGI